MNPNFFNGPNLIENSSELIDYLSFTKDFFNKDLFERKFFKPVVTSRYTNTIKLAFFGINAYSNKEYIESFSKDDNFAVIFQDDYQKLRDKIFVYENNLNMFGCSYYSNIFKDLLSYENGFGNEKRLLSEFKYNPTFKNAVENLVYFEVKELILKGCDIFILMGNFTWYVFEMVRKQLSIESISVKYLEEGNIMVLENNGRHIKFIAEYHFSRSSRKKSDYTEKIIKNLK